MPNGGQHDTRVSTRAACLAVNKAATANYRDLPPPDFSASATSSDTIKLAMPSPVPDADTYDIQRSMDGISWAIVEKLITAAQLAEYLDGAVTAGNKYYYQARSVNPHGKSRWGATRSATTPTTTSLSGGTAALGYSAPSLGAGETLTITTDGTYAFGDVGPEFIWLLDPAVMTLGDADLSEVERAAGVTVAINSYPRDIQSVAGLPGGKGLVVGGRGDDGAEPWRYGQFRVTHPYYTRIFESRAFYYPQVNQDNAIEHFTLTYAGHPDTETARWGAKTIWNMTDFKDGSNDGFDAYFINVPVLYFPSGGSKGAGSSATWTIDTKIVGNDNATDYFPSKYEYRNLSDTYKRPYAEPYLIEEGFDQGVLLDGSADGSAFQFISTPAAPANFLESLADIVLTHTSAIAETRINTFAYPGYVRGFPVIYDAHYYEGDVYRAGGPGAYCRVAISDHADYFQSTKRTILRPLSWANGELKMKLRSGWFDLANLSGKYLNIMGINNTQIGSIAL